MKFLGIIPARYNSTRFPGKMLAMIGGKSMVRRVYEQCAQSTLLTDLIIATDDERIKNECEGFGATVVMTKEEHPSGTDRCFEAYQKLGKSFDFVINIQGDEPFIKPEQIDMLLTGLDKATELATLIKVIDNNDILFNVGNVKVTFNKNREALYFSRQAIPFIRGTQQDNWLNKTTFYEHIGLYSYRTDILEAVSSLEPSPLETAESLEQLRWLENGFKIKVLETQWDSFCVETPEDLVLAEKHLQTIQK